MSDRLPNFFIIGTMKGATTSLWNYLGQHPEIFMSPIKETRYFAVKSFAPDKVEIIKRHPLWKNTITSLDEYYRLFEGVKDESIVGEASPLYMAYPFVSKNIREMIPEARILACLRQPAERAFSHFQHNRALGFEKRADFINAVYDDGRLNYAGYYRLGFYAEQLESYFEQFPENQIKICYYDQLVQDPEGVLSSIFDFLGIDPSFTPDTSVLHNKGAKGGSLDHNTKRLLTLPYIEDIRKLEGLDGVDLSAWYTLHSSKAINRKDKNDMHLSPWYYAQ